MFITSTTTTCYTNGISFGSPLYTLGGGMEVFERSVLGSWTVVYTLRQLKLNLYINHFNMCF
jgi:hypothetical protein